MAAAVDKQNLGFERLRCLWGCVVDWSKQLSSVRLVGAIEAGAFQGGLSNIVFMGRVEASY